MNHPFLQAALGCAILLAHGCAAPPQSFTSPDDAAAALVAAARTHSTEQLTAILGGASDDILASGDPVADQQLIADFLSRYDERHELVTEPDGRVSLVVGHNEWPMPIPLVHNANTGAWHFDVEQGREEVVDRRVGRNELNAIQVCLAIADAQREYATLDADGDGVAEYGRRFASEPGTKNGLYWPTRDGETPSPLGPLAAEASAEGYTRSASGAPTPYHGYVFRMITAQGPDAPGGARDYVVGGMMIGGFAVVAYPVDYGVSGVMSFIVNHEGVVHERDLGSATSRTARSMKQYNCSPEWTRVEVIE